MESFQEIKPTLFATYIYIIHTYIHTYILRWCFSCLVPTHVVMPRSCFQTVPLYLLHFRIVVILNCLFSCHLDSASCSDLKISHRKLYFQNQRSRPKSEFRWTISRKKCATRLQDMFITLFYDTFECLLI